MTRAKLHARKIREFQRQRIGRERQLEAELEEFAEQCPPIEFSADGQKLHAAVQNDGSLRLYPAQLNTLEVAMLIDFLMENYANEA